MTTPVSFQLAKLLKEKDYNEACGMLYNDNGVLSGTKMGMHSYPNNYTNKYSAPTIAEVVMWLYEKHQIWINVNVAEDLNLFWYEIRGIIRIWFTGKNCNSPTEAYENAIQYVLNNLL